MKKVRIISLLVALVMLGCCVISCGSTSSNKTVNCTVSVVVKGEYVIDSVECPVKSTSEDGPVVLDAAKLALDFLGVDYQLSSTNLKRVKIDGVEYAEGIDASGENMWFWEYTANGVAPENGSAAVNKIVEGDDIAFVFTSIPVESNKTEDDENADLEVEEVEEDEEPEAEG